MLQSLLYLRLPRSKLLHHTLMDLCMIYTVRAVSFFLQSCRRVVDFRLKDQGTPILSIGSEDQLLQGKFIKNSFDLNLENVKKSITRYIFLHKCYCIIFHIQMYLPWYCNKICYAVVCGFRCGRVLAFYMTCKSLCRWILCWECDAFSSKKRELRKRRLYDKNIKAIITLL